MLTNAGNLSDHLVSQGRAGHLTEVLVHHLQELAMHDTLAGRSRVQYEDAGERFGVWDMIRRVVQKG